MTYSRSIWAADELATLRAEFPAGGLASTTTALPLRSPRSIQVKASRLGLRSPVAAPARKLNLRGAALARAVRLREVEGWSFARIGVELGVCETAASNAVHVATCAARGHRPAARDAAGKLFPAEIERMRYMLMKGVKGIEIQRRMAVSAACVADYRRQYNADLLARGKRLLPPPGNGERYAGSPLLTSTKREIERLLLTGMGCAKIERQVEASHTAIVRQRALLIARLKAKGEALPGCDPDGRRVKVFGHAGAIPQATKDRFFAMLVDAVPVRRAAKLCGIGGCSAYRLRDQLRADLAAAGAVLPPPNRAGRLSETARRLRAEEEVAPANLRRLRNLIHQHGDAEGRRILADQLRAEKAPPSSFEQQLARVAAGSRLVSTFRAVRTDPSQTLGGVASNAL